MHEIIRLVALYGIIVPAVLALYVFFTLRRRHVRIEFITVVLGRCILSLILTRMASHLISDPRPFVVGHFTPLISHTNDNGFPSDHTLFASFVGFTLLRYSKWPGITALLVGVGIGLAHVVVGMHHFEDIIGSFIITGIAVSIIMCVLQAIRKHKKVAGS